MSPAIWIAIATTKCLDRDGCLCDRCSSDRHMVHIARSWGAQRRIAHLSRLIRAHLQNDLFKRMDSPETPHEKTVKCSVEYMKCERRHLKKRVI